MSAPTLRRTATPRETGVVEALVAVTGVCDDVNDIIVPGAFERTLRERPLPRVCFRHDWERTIGTALDVKELLPGDPRLPATTADGRPWPREAGALLARYQLDLDTRDGREAYREMRRRGARHATHSIGYKTRIKRGERPRLLYDLDLFEFSQVRVPAMRWATALSVKGGPALTSPVHSAHQSDSEDGIEVKMRYVRDAAYWGYPIGTPITGRMKPKGPTARQLRRRGRTPSRVVGTAEKPAPASGAPAAGVPEGGGVPEGVDEGLFPEPTPSTRLRAGQGATGEIDIAVDNLVRELGDGRHGKPDETYPDLLREGVTPAELDAELRESDQWPAKLSEAERDDLIDSAVTAYRGVYAARAQRQAEHRERAERWQQPSAEEIERLARQGEDLIGDWRNDAELITVVAALGHDDPEGFVDHLTLVQADGSLDAAIAEFDTFVATRREGAQADPTLAALPDLPEIDNLDSIDEAELVARLQAAQARMDGLEARGERRDTDDSYDAREAVAALTAETQRRARDQAERERIEVMRRAENTATGAHVVEDAPALAMTAAEYTAAQARAEARRARARNVTREREIATREAEQRERAERLAETAPLVIDVDAFAERHARGKAEPVGGGRLMLVAGGSKNWQLNTAANMILVRGGEFSPGAERSVDTPKNPGKRALRDLADRLAAITDAQGRPAPWTAPPDPADAKAGWLQGWRDAQGHNLIAASVEVIGQWAREHDLYYSRAERDYHRPDTVPGGASDADGFRMRIIEELAPGDEIRTESGEVGTVALVKLKVTAGDMEAMWGAEQAARIPDSSGGVALERSYAGSVTLTDGREVGFAPITASAATSGGRNPHSAVVSIRFAGDPDAPDAGNDPGMGPIHPDQGPPGQRVSDYQGGFTGREQPVPEGTRFAALASEEPSVWGRDERPTVGTTVDRVHWEAGMVFQTVRYDDGTYGQVRIGALRGQDLSRHKTAHPYVLGPTDEQVAEIHAQWGLADSAGGEPVAELDVDQREREASTSDIPVVAEPEPPSVAIEPELVDEAEALADEVLGIIETEDGALEVTPEVADRQDRLVALFDDEQAGRLDLAAKTDDELGGIRTDLIDELRLQTALERRDTSAVRRAPAEPKPAAEEAGAPRVRPGLAGAAEDHAEALRSGDDEAIIRTRTRLESSLRRSRASSPIARALADHVNAEDANEADTLATLADQLRQDARTRRRDSARKRRTARRLERERLRSLLGQVDAELGRRRIPVTAPPGELAPLSEREYAAHVSGIEQKINAAFTAGQATHVAHTVRGEGTVWLPARAAQHKEIVDTLWARADGVPTEGRAVIAGGLGGAGKSTVLRGQADINPDDYFTINPDDIKEELARRGLVPDVAGLSPMEASALIHEESSHLANLLARRAYASRVSVMWDITMSRRASVTQRIAELRAAGYGQVDAVFVDIPVEVSVSRALARHRWGMERHRRGEGQGGRYVPPALIRASASDVTSSANRDVFDAIQGEFDNWVVYDNSVTGQAPTKVEDSGRWESPASGDGSGEGNGLTNREYSATVDSMDSANPWKTDPRGSLRALPPRERSELTRGVNPARFTVYADQRAKGSDHVTALTVARGGDADGPSLFAESRQLELVAAEQANIPTNLYGAELMQELDRVKGNLARERKRILATERHDSPDRENRIAAAKKRIVLVQALADLNHYNPKTEHVTDNPAKMTASRLSAQIAALEGSPNAVDRRRLAVLKRAAQNRGITPLDKPAGQLEQLSRQRISQAKPQLLASSSTLEGITRQVNKFWASTAYTVDPDTLEIRHPSKPVNPSVRIVKVKGRYRFEMIESSPDRRTG